MVQPEYVSLVVISRSFYPSIFAGAANGTPSSVYSDQTIPAAPHDSDQVNVDLAVAIPARFLCLDSPGNAPFRAAKSAAWNGASFSPLEIHSLHGPPEIGQVVLLVVLLRLGRRAAK